MAAIKVEYRRAAWGLIFSRIFIERIPRKDAQIPPITIKRGDPFMHIEFLTRIGESSPYTGTYQFQYVTEDEKKMYLPILRKVFPNFDELAEIWFKKKHHRRDEASLL